MYIEPEHENKVIKSVKIICYAKNSLTQSTWVRMYLNEEKYGEIEEREYDDEEKEEEEEEEDEGEEEEEEVEENEFYLSDVEL